MWPIIIKRKNGTDDDTEERERGKVELERYKTHVAKCMPFGFALCQLISASVQSFSAISSRSRCKARPLLLYKNVIIVGGHIEDDNDDGDEDADDDDDDDDDDNSVCTSPKYHDDNDDDDDRRPTPTTVVNSNLFIAHPALTQNLTEIFHLFQFNNLYFYFLEYLFFNFIHQNLYHVV